MSIRTYADVHQLSKGRPSEFIQTAIKTFMDVHQTSYQCPLHLSGRPSAWMQTFTRNAVEMITVCTSMYLLHMILKLGITYTTITYEGTTIILKLQLIHWHPDWRGLYFKLIYKYKYNILRLIIFVHKRLYQHLLTFVSFLKEGHQDLCCCPSEPSWTSINFHANVHQNIHGCTSALIWMFIKFYVGQLSCGCPSIPLWMSIRTFMVILELSYEFYFINDVPGLTFKCFMAR